MERICQQKWWHGEQASPGTICAAPVSQTQNTLVENVQFRSVISAQHSNLTKTQRDGPRDDVLGTASPVFGKKLVTMAGKRNSPIKKKSSSE